MTPREIAAFNAGIETARQIALIAAMTLEVRDDARAVRQQAAAAALQGLAEGLRALADDVEGAHLARTPESEALRLAFARIADERGISGVIPCPACAGRLRWTRDSTNGHLHGECEAEGCLRWME